MLMWTTGKLWFKNEVLAQYHVDGALTSESNRVMEAETFKRQLHMSKANSNSAGGVPSNFSCLECHRLFHAQIKPVSYIYNN